MEWRTTSAVERALEVYPHSPPARSDRSVCRGSVRNGMLCFFLKRSSWVCHAQSIRATPRRTLFFFFPLPHDGTLLLPSSDVAEKRRAGLFSQHVCKGERVIFARATRRSTFTSPCPTACSNEGRERQRHGPRMILCLSWTRAERQHRWTSRVSARAEDRKEAQSPRMLSGLSLCRRTGGGDQVASGGQRKVQLHLPSLHDYHSRPGRGVVSDKARRQGASVNAGMLDTLPLCPTT